MGSEDHIVEQLNILSAGLSEELLVSLSNKGTVNRAKKDLEKLRESIAIAVSPQGEVTVTLGEDALVTLKDTPGACKCTCPSTGVCRHIVTAVLYGMEYLASRQGQGGEEGEKPEPANVTPEDLTELNQLTEEQVRKLVGKKDYAALVPAIRRKNEAEFSYEQMLKVTIPSQGVTVYFPREHSLEGAVCSCKSRDICRHKAYAILSYLITQRGVKLRLEDDVPALVGEQKELLDQVQGQLAGFMDKGMASLAPDSVKQLERLYIRAYGMKLYALAGELKLLASYFHEYFSKNVSFSNTRTLHLICKCCNRAEALRHAGEEERGFLVGRLREESLQLNSLTLYGLGAAARLTKRQDLLAAEYFYCPDLEEFLVLPTLRPLEGQENRSVGVRAAVERTKEYLYTAGLFWAEEYSLKELSGYQLELKDAVVTAGRLSGTKNSSARKQGALTIQDLEAAAVNSFADLQASVRSRGYQYFSRYEAAADLYLVEVSRIGEPAYDMVGQRLLLPIKDSQGQEMTLEIRFSEASKKAIERLEDTMFKPDFSHVLIRAFERRHSLWGELLAGWDQAGGRELYF